MCLYGCERVCVRTQVQSSSSVLILRVLTVSIESSWQLKEEHKIGKWGGVSMLRPLPPHSSLAEDVWIYSGNATFERNKWEGSSFLLCVWIPSSGVSLCNAVQHKAKEGESGLGSCSVPFFVWHCITFRVYVLYMWVGDIWKHCELRQELSICHGLHIEYYILSKRSSVLSNTVLIYLKHTSVVQWGQLCQYQAWIWE